MRFCLDVAGAMSKQSTEGMAWLLFAAYSQVWEERDQLRELFGKKKPELEDLENFQPIYVVKKWESMLWRELPGCGWITICEEMRHVACGAH